MSGGLDDETHDVRAALFGIINIRCFIDQNGTHYVPAFGTAPDPLVFRMYTFWSDSVATIANNYIYVIASSRHLNQEFLLFLFK